MVKTQSLHFSPASMLLGMMTILCTGCASDGVRQQAVYERDMERTKQSLIAAGDADSLAAAAMLGFGPKVDPMQRLTLIARAVKEAPDRPDLVWLNVRLCTQVESCNSEPLEAQLHALDPDNGAAWSDSIGRAGKRNDVVAVRKDMVAVATSTRFDTYWNATIFHVTNAIVKTHTMNLSTAFIATIGVASAISIPAYQTIVNACKGEALNEPDVVATCRHVAYVMRHGDTCITEMVGIAIAKRAWPEGSAEYLDAVSARRVAHYRMDTDGRIGLHHFWNSRYAAKRLQLMTEKKTEQEVNLAEIMNAKLSPNPSSDWPDKWGGS